MSSMWPETDSVSSQLPPPRSISSTRPFRDAGISEHAQVNQAAFFQAGDHFDLPSGGRAHPVEKGAAIARIAQCAGGDHADTVGRVGLSGPMKAPQHAQGERHRLRIKSAVGKDAFAQAGNFAVLMQGLQAAPYDLGYF